MFGDKLIKGRQVFANHLRFYVGIRCSTAEESFARFTRKPREFPRNWFSVLGKYDAVAAKCTRQSISSEATVETWSKQDFLMEIAM